MKDEDADEAAPEQAGEAGEERPADRPTEEERQQQPDDRPEDEGAVDPGDDRVLDQVGGETLLVAALGMDEDPADVGVGQAPQRTAPAVPMIDVRAVRVALLVGEGVVLAVVGDPGDDRALDRRRPEDRQEAMQPAIGLESAVGEVAVEADRDPEAGEEVHAEEDEDVGPVQCVPPDLPGGDAERDERDHGDEAGDDPVEGLVLNRLDVVRTGAGCGRCRRRLRQSRRLRHDG